MIENSKLEEIRSVENQQSGEYKINSPKCIKSAVHNSNNNKYINNNYNSYQSKNLKYQGRTYPPGFLDKLYANNSLINDI